MGQYDLFRKIAQSSLTTKQRAVIQIQNDIIADFKSSPSYESVTISNTSRDVQIVDESYISKSENKKRILGKPNETFGIGEIVVWDSANWIITGIDSNKQIQYKGSIEKSNNTLKFYSSIPPSSPNPITNEPYQIPCFIGKGNINLSVDKFISLASDEYIVSCPNTVDSLKIGIGTRFILSNSAYVVIGTDVISNVGLLDIKIKEDLINTVDDNLELGIANWLSHQPIYTMQLISNPIMNLQNLNQTSQIELTLLVNGVIDTSPILSITNSNPSIVTINNSTLIVTCIGTGNSEITIAYHGQVVTISVTGIGSISHNYAVSISPSTTISIKVGQQSTFSALFTNNGDPFPFYSYWTLLDDTETIVTDLATILSTSGTYNENITLKANSISKYGYCKLIVKDVSGTIIYVKRLQIKSLY